jgi:hypothetical protein
LIAAKRSSALNSTPIGFCFEEKNNEIRKKFFLADKNMAINYDDEAMRFV